MKKTLISSLAAVGLLFAASTGMAQDAKKISIIQGEGKCGKCALKMAEQCTNVIEAKAKDGGEKVVYWIKDSDVSKAFHGNVCTKTVKTVAAGTVSEQDGKKWVDVVAIEVAVN